MVAPDLHPRVESIRRFNRFYTRHIGVLREGYVRTAFPLTEARVIFELARRGESTATELGRDLGIDAGYLSRILRSFESRALIQKERAPHDGRQRLLRLTDAGQDAYGVLNARSRDEVTAMLGRMKVADQERLLGAMHTIEEIFEAEPEKTAPFVLRSLQTGDIGWLTHRHGVIYYAEYGWDGTFEALVAKILSEVVLSHDPRWSRAWIAEIDGEIVGSVFCEKGSETVAKLRLLLVEPKARGQGLGTRLVDECIGFARRAGYRKMTLYTNDVLSAARRIYERAGFALAEEWEHHSFGHALVGQNWELDLT